MKAHIFVHTSSPTALPNLRGPLIATLVRRGHKVTACAPEIDEAVARELAELGADTYSVPLDRGGMNPIKDIQYYRHLKQLVGRLKPDIFLGFNIKPVIWGSIAAKRAGVTSVIATITGVGFSLADGSGIRHLIAGHVARLLYRRGLAHCHGVIFQNTDDRKLFYDQKLINKTDTFLVNGSGVDLERFSSKPIPQGLTFITICRLLSSKGVREYVEAGLNLRAKYPHVRIRVVGEGDPHSPDTIAVSELETWRASGIEFLGKLEDVRPAIAEASVFVLPSYREGTPRAVLEAMAMARPIITTDVPGCRDTTIDNFNGFIVPARDSVSLFGAMEKFVVSPQLIEAMGANSLARAQEKYDVHLVNKQIMQIMFGVLDGRDRLPDRDPLEDA